MRPQALRGRGKSRGAGAAGSGTQGPSIHAPIQATVVRVVAEVGQDLAEGDLVVVLESMKMEKPIYAHAAGTVKAVHIAAADTVKAGDLLVTIDAAQDN